MNITPPSYNPADLDSLFGIFQLFMRQYLGAWLATVQPVEIASIAENNCFVNVKPLIQLHGTTNNLIPITDDDIICNIPVMHPLGANGEIRFNPAIGDQGLLVAGNFDITNYKQTKSQAPEGSYRSFNWADGFFLPLSFETADDGLLLRNKQSFIKVLEENINVISQSVNLGGDNGKGVARLGDEVTVQITSGSSAGTWKGTITSSSSVVKAI